MSVQLPTAASIEALHRKVDDLLERGRIMQTAQLERFFEQMFSGPDAVGFDPLRVYNVNEVAYLLGAHPKSVYNIPESELPKVRRIGSHIGYHGINILAYQLGRDPVDVESIYEAYLKKALQDQPRIRNIEKGSTGLTRVH